jgi:hypothetical protein
MKTNKCFAIGLFFIAAATARPQDSGALTRASDGNDQAKLYQHMDFQKVSINYLYCLNSGVPGIVESALGHVTYMRIAFPKQNLRDIQAKILDLATRGTTRSIRYKAFTALEVFADPSAFEHAIERRGGNGDGLLDEIGARLLTQADLTAK